MICFARHIPSRAVSWIGGVLSVYSLIAPLPAHADVDADAKIARLLQLLVEKKIVTPKQAHELFRETEAPRKATPRAKETAAQAEEPPAKNTQLRITYVPSFIRKQIADEVRAQVMGQVQQEGWAEPNSLPEWTKNFKLYGDMRVRYERDSFNSGNDNTFLNYASINNGSAFDFNTYLSGTGAPPPFLNTTEGRDRERVRARIGMEAFIDDGWSANIRIGTGSDQGPVTPNQTLGQPGDFSKYQAYIDRAYFTYHPLDDLTFYAGREPDPFFTTDLIFYGDLGFDGISGAYTPQLTDNIGLFLTGGAFPILNTAFDFSTTSETKYASTNAYLLAIQGGAKWRLRPDLTAKLGVGFFDFNGVQGAVSKPCLIQPGNVFTCSTDSTRFPFEQFGNTVFAIRDINTESQTTGSSSNLPQTPEYFGLASRFEVLEVHPRLEITTYDPIDLSLEGEYLKNFGFNRAEILNHGPATATSGGVSFVGPLNNFGSIGKKVGAGPYQAGDTAYLLKATLGHLEIHKRWDWNVTVGYKYLATDATLDSINDADFHLGGTNAKGYLLGGSLGVAKDTYISLRYFSAEVVSGSPDGNQVLQLDLLSSF
jgi:hypothetical protein